MTDYRISEENFRDIESSLSHAQKLLANATPIEPPPPPPTKPIKAYLWDEAPGKMGESPHAIEMCRPFINGNPDPTWCAEYVKTWAKNRHVDEVTLMPHGFGTTPRQRGNLRKVGFCATPDPWWDIGPMIEWMQTFFDAYTGPPITKVWFDNEPPFMVSQTFEGLKYDWWLGSYAKAINGVHYLWQWRRGEIKTDARWDTIGLLHSGKTLADHWAEAGEPEPHASNDNPYNSPLWSEWYIGDVLWPQFRHCIDVFASFFTHYEKSCVFGDWWQTTVTYPAGRHRAECPVFYFSKNPRDRVDSVVAQIWPIYSALPIVPWVKADGNPGVIEACRANNINEVIVWWNHNEPPPQATFDRLAEQLGY